MLAAQRLWIDAARVGALARAETRDALARVQGRSVRPPLLASSVRSRLLGFCVHWSDDDYAGPVM